MRHFGQIIKWAPNTFVGAKYHNADFHFYFDTLENGGHLFSWYQGKIVEGIEEMCFYSAAGK